MIRQIQAKQPEAEFVSANIQHIAHAGQLVHLGMRTPGHLAMSNSYYFDGNAKLLGDGGLETGTIGKQILGALQPLHFGWFGGFLVKVIYGILGLALTIVTHSGITIWLARRRDAGRPAPHWEKVWSGVTWGQPLAFATTAVTVFTIGDAYALAVYVVTVVVCIAGALAASEANTAGRLMRLATGAAILAAVSLHAVEWSGRLADGLALWVAATFAATGIAFLISGLRPLLSSAPASA
jgi:hypothetical protein